MRQPEGHCWQALVFPRRPVQKYAASTRHSELQPSPSAWLLSSHSSEEARSPSPQTTSQELLEELRKSPA